MRVKFRDNFIMSSLECMNVTDCYVIRKNKYKRQYLVFTIEIEVTMGSQLT